MVEAARFARPGRGTPIALSVRMMRVRFGSVGTSCGKDLRADHPRFALSGSWGWQRYGASA